MSAVVNLRDRLPATRSAGLPAAVHPVQTLPTWARTEAFRRLGQIQPALDRVISGASIHAAAHWLHMTVDGVPSPATIERWLRDYQGGGLVNLAPSWKGRQRREYGWEARALELYQSPNRPAYNTVALWLREEGHETASNHLVRRYIQSAPSNLSETSPKRVGKHYYAQNIKPHIVRDRGVLPVGLVYQADGHCCDVYVQHPGAGKHYRPELTVLIDPASGYVVGWWMSESESALTTLFALSHAFVSQDHVPSYFHVDPGSGFKNKLINDETTGFLTRMSVEPIVGLPGNARGHGLIEGWWRWFEERCGKRFEAYCGHCRTDDALHRLEYGIRRGAIRIPTFAEYCEAVARYIESYNHREQPSLDGLSPAQLWAGLERTPVSMDQDALMRPETTCMVRSWRVRFQNRRYQADALRGYERRKVRVQYSIHDDAHVWIYDDKGRFVCEADLVDKKDWLPASRIEEGQQRRLEGQRKRLQKHLDEAEARSHRPLSAAAMFDVLEGDVSAQPAIPDLTPAAYAKPLPAPKRPVREIPRDAIDRVAAHMQEEAEEQETADDRFARACALERAAVMNDAEAQWLRIYQSSSEYSSRRLLQDEFQDDAGAPTPASDTTTRLDDGSQQRGEA